MHYMHYERSTLSPLCDASFAFSFGLLRAARGVLWRLWRRRDRGRGEYGMVSLRADSKED